MCLVWPVRSLACTAVFNLYFKCFPKNSIVISEIGTKNKLQSISDRLNNQIQEGDKLTGSFNSSVREIAQTIES